MTVHGASVPALLQWKSGSRRGSMGIVRRSITQSLRRRARGVAVEAERRWDSWRFSRAADRAPRALRFDPYLGHGNPMCVVVRGRLLDGNAPSEAADGESVWSAVRRTVASFLTDELPGVPIRVRLGSTTVEAVTDDEGYFDVRLQPDLAEHHDAWAEGTVGLAGPYRGITTATDTPVRVLIPRPETTIGVISDVDDTIMETGAQRALAMIRQTLTGSALTRTTFRGAPELYRALCAGHDGGQDRPFFYVSSSPWNLHRFLIAFLEHRGFPLGPVLLRDLLGNGETRTHRSGKLRHIAEILDLHPGLSFILIGDSGQHDPEIYAEVVRDNPGRIRAVYIREVRLDPGDGRVEEIVDGWDHPVPFVLAADSATAADHAAGLGLISPDQARCVRREVTRAGPAS